MNREEKLLRFQKMIRDGRQKCLDDDPNFTPVGISWLTYILRKKLFDHKAGKQSGQGVSMVDDLIAELYDGTSLPVPKDVYHRTLLERNLGTKLPKPKNVRAF